MSAAEDQQQPAGGVRTSSSSTSGGPRPCSYEGYLDKESKNSKWNRRYFMLEATCLRYYKDNPERLPEEERQSRGEIRVKRIIGVDETTAKDHRSCLEIQTASGPIYLAAYSDQERSQWIEQIQKACKHASSEATLNTVTGSLSLDDPSIGPASGAGKPDTSGTKTRVVGGVVMRLPMKGEVDAPGASDSRRVDVPGASESRTDDAEVGLAPPPHSDRGMSLGSGGGSGAAAGGQPGLNAAHSGTSLPPGHRKDGPRVLKSGFCVKQGHLRKNWKKRFFLLDPFGFAYYSSDTDKEPIKNIPVHEILAVSECTSFSNRQNVFQLVTNGCIYYVQPPTREDMLLWVKAIEGELQGAVKPCERSARRSLKL